MPLAFVLSIIVVLNSAPAGDPLAPCAWVRAENDGAGAGFVIDVEKKLLLTCRHVVAEQTKVDVIFPWIRDGELVTDRNLYLANRVRLRELGLLVTGKVLRQSDELDLALVELESVPTGVKAATFSTRAPQLGEPLRVFGNRIDLETVWNLSIGPVRSAGRLADGYFWRGKKLATDANALIAQLPTEEGDSGAAAFDSRGEVVGMVAALRRQCPLAAVVIAAKDIRAFAGLGEPPAKEKVKPLEVAEKLNRATVWVRPTATDVHLAGALIENDLVLTIGKGLAKGDRVGIAFPIRDGDKWIADRAAYRDALGLQLKGYWRSGTVLARDGDRDLALIRLDSPVANMRPLKLAANPPVAGDAIHTMNHPGGLEFAWVYAAGAVRQRGSLAIVPGDKARPVAMLVCQLPAQAGSPGGPVVNDKGELFGLVAAKESAQLVGYAVAVEEIAEFLDVALLDRPARTLPGLLARIEAYPGLVARGVALGLVSEAYADFGGVDSVLPLRKTRAALEFDPICCQAHLCMAAWLLANKRQFPENLDRAVDELDAAVEKGPFHRVVLLVRAQLVTRKKDWRKARGDLERLLDVDPADAVARQWLIGVLLGLGEDAKAAAAVRDTLRADPKRLQMIAADLVEQADELAKKFPDAPSIPAGWLMKAMTASKRAEFAEVLKRAAAAKTDEEKLTILRGGAKKVAGK